MYPTIILTNNSVYAQSLDSLKIGNLYAIINPTKKQDFIFTENQNFIFLSHTNKGFQDIYRQNYSRSTGISLEYAGFQWGFLLIFNKKNSEVTLFNDPFGIYPLYYKQDNTGFMISNDLDAILKSEKPISLNPLGLYDYIFYNYTIHNRTFIENLNRLPGGSKITFSKNKISVSKAFDLNTFVSTDKKYSVEEMLVVLQQNIKHNIDPKLETGLAITGGFDTKVILSILLNQKIDFSSFTYGAPETPDCIAAKSIASQFGLEHTVFSLDPYFTNNFETEIDDFIRNAPNLPMLDSILYYQLLKHKLNKSNFIAGFMGGEFIVGPVLIAQLLTTKAAYFLGKSRNKEEFERNILNIASNSGVLRVEVFNKYAENYSEIFEKYFVDNRRIKNLSIFEFLMQETYAKFFGSVFSNLFGNYNYIAPFADISFLKMIINSEFSFTNKKPYSKDPFLHFLSRRFYPKLIKLAYPEVLKSKMERGYNLEDFLHWYKFYKPFWNYFKRHSGNKIKNASQIDFGYNPLLRSLILKNLRDSEILQWEIFDPNSIQLHLDNLQNGQISNFHFQKLSQLLTIHYLVNRYSYKS